MTIDTATRKRLKEAKERADKAHDKAYDATGELQDEVAAALDAGATHAEVARALGVSRGRISAIVKQRARRQGQSTP